MSTYRVVNPYSGLNFDFHSYEAEVERGRRRIVIVLLLNLAVVLANIISSQIWLAQQAVWMEKLLQLPLVIQNVPDTAVLMKQVTAFVADPLYPLYLLLSQIALYVVIAVLPWTAIYLAKEWARNLVGFFAVFLGFIGIVGGALLLWYGLYSMSALALAYGAIKLYTVTVLFGNSSVKRYFSHSRL